MTDPIYRRVISPVLRPKVRTYDALLLATGADPVRLNAGDAPLPVHQLRTLAAAHALAVEAVKARRAVVMGAGFIGLEVTAALRARGVEVSRCRGVEVHVVTPGAIPMQRVLGDHIGRFASSSTRFGQAAYQASLSAKTRRLWGVPGV